MSLLNAKPFPSFFRFGRVRIYLSTLFFDEEGEGILDSQLIAEKCQLFEDQLKLIKPALNGSILNFDFIIDQSKPSCFYDHDQVLEYLRNRLLPICNKSHGYEFWINFNSDANTARFIITSILQMDQIDRCSNVKIDFPIDVDDGTKLPIDEISNWLHRSCDGGGQRERSLFIQLEEIKSIVEVFVHLKEVFILIFANLKSLKSILSALSTEL